jgi:hypothetical protein
VPNDQLYDKLPRVSSRLLEKQLIVAGHCVRSDQPVSDLVFWDHTKMTKCKCTPEIGSRAKLVADRANK